MGTWTPSVSASLHKKDVLPGEFLALSRNQLILEGQSLWGQQNIKIATSKALRYRKEKI